MIDLLLRGGAMALLAMWAALALTGPRRQPVYALACLCGALFVAVKSGPIAAALGPVLAPAQALAMTGPLWFLIATRRAFGAPALLKSVHLGALGGAIVAVALAAAYAPRGLKAGLFAGLDLAMLALFIATLVTAWRGLADDLDPGRRTQRILLLNVSAAFGAVITIGAVAAAINLVPAGWGAPSQTVIAAGVCATAFALCMITLQRRDIDLRPQAARTGSAPAAASPLALKIRTAMQVDRLYRDPALTVSRLADVLKAPEHQVRAAINAELGFRNFSAFINDYRLTEAKAALADAAQAQTPISTIALDAGFGSIASFNRVFKTAFGVAPSAFRKGASG
jgi:AraC-like DNA-binding protein